MRMSRRGSAFERVRDIRQSSPHRPHLRPPSPIGRYDRHMMRKASAGAVMTTKVALRRESSALKLLGSSSRYSSGLPRRSVMLRVYLSKPSWLYRNWRR